MNKAIQYLTDSNYRFKVNSFLGLYNGLSDQAFLEKAFLMKFRRRLDLDNPKSLNEKTQWLKLHDRDSRYIKMADKADAKEVLGKIIGEQYIIKTIGIWDHYEDIDFTALPDRFVIKTTHDSGGVCICHDKKSFDYNACAEKLKKSLKHNYYYVGREWPYKDMNPRIIAEELIETVSPEGLVEYKIFCFNGTAKLVLVCKGTAHGSGRTNDFFTREFEHVPVTVTFPNSKTPIRKPKSYDLLLSLAEKVADGIPFLRVDLYLADERIYIGETTFYHDSGWCPYNPVKYDYEFGDLLQLPQTGREK